jgi:hypothetical protein
LFDLQGDLIGWVDIFQFDPQRFLIDFDFDPTGPLAA